MECLHPDYYCLGIQEDIMYQHDFDDITDGRVNARRNLYMGVWAGRILGLKENAMNDYVSSVMEIDHEEPGPFVVVRKIRRDLAAKGHECQEDELLERLKSYERAARSEMCVTD